MMNRYSISIVIVALIFAPSVAFSQSDSTCFESRKGAGFVVKTEVSPGLPNVKCSPETGAVLWWGDPYHGTQAMGDMPIKGDYSKGEAVVKPREPNLTLLPICGVACHNGIFPPMPKDKRPRKLTMHNDIVADSLKLQHGRGAIWCLDCHHTEKRNKLVDNFGDEISFNEPQKLCGKCHGQVYRDWRGGIHGKRIGQWASDGKKRWFVCTECHNPHDVQQGTRNSGFVLLKPERAPILPKGIYNTDHERHRDVSHGDSDANFETSQQH